MSKNNPDANRPADNEGNPSGQDIRRNTEALKLLTKKLEQDAKDAATKKVKDKIKTKVVRILATLFFLCQLIGTYLILKAWIVQNEELGANSSQIATRENVKAEIRELSIATNLDQSRADFNSYINHELKDSNMAESRSFVSILANLCHDQIKLLKATLKNVPDTATIVKKEELSKQFDYDSLTIERLKSTGSVQQMSNWLILQSMTFGNLYYLTLKAGNDQDAVIQEQKDEHARQWNHWYKWGTILLIASLFRGVVDIFK